jgi:hypothetical protein
MATVDDALQTQIRNIEATYGRTIPEWFAVIDASGLTKHTEVVAMLKTQHGLAHGAAHRVSLLSRERDAPTPEGDPADALYTGKRAGLRPMHDAVIAYLHTLGDDIEVVPKKGYLSIRRAKQFAMLKPGADRIDIGLILKDVPTTNRLEDAGTFNALFTHRVRIHKPADLDRELRGWLASAYKIGGR